MSTADQREPEGLTEIEKDLKRIAASIAEAAQKLSDLSRSILFLWKWYWGLVALAGLALLGFVYMLITG